MEAIELRFESAPEAVAIGRALDETTSRSDGHESIGDATWRSLEAGDASSATVVAWHAEEPIALVHVGRSDTFTPQHWAAGLVVSPGWRAATLVRDLLDAAAAHVRELGGGTTVLWVFDPPDDVSAGIESAGFEHRRDLFQMRVKLPLAERPSWPPGVATRTFEPGRDEAAWLDVNNRAFGDHPEQGGWVEATLQRRMDEPWFDPELFLLAFDDDGLAGFNWLKLHPATELEPELGEIFVIGVDPRCQGTGLGRALAIAGLDLVARRGVTTGLLYVAAENEAAVGLYRALGFSVHRTDRAYERTVEA